MSKGAGSNKEAIKLQRESMAESSRANREMIALLTAQQENARNLKLPQAAPTLPLPQMGSADMVAQGQETRRNLMKRHGLAATNVVAMQAQPLRTALGTPVFQPLAAAA
jgi:hypothetical protein